MSVDDDLERRLLNWTRWMLSSAFWSRARYGSGGFPWGRARGYREATMPILSGEAIDTDRAIALLEPDLQRALRGWYLGEIADGVRVPAWNQDSLALALDCSRSTFQRRLAEARRMVQKLID